jgi:hypothetical protein
MIGITTEGILGFAERGRAVWRAISAAIRFTLLDRFMPWWLKPLYILRIHWIRASEEDVIFATPNLTKERRRAIYLGWTALLSVVFVILPDTRRAVTIYNLTGYWLAAGTALWDHLVADKPPDLDSWNWWLRRDIAVLLPSLQYAFANLRLLRSACKILITWMALPIIACFLTCWLAVKRTRHSFTIPEGIQWSAHKFIENFNRLWDIIDLIEAFLVEYLPERAQWSYSHWTERLRSWQRVPMYQYKPLAPGEIRILRLKRCIWPLPSVIQATIHHIPIDSKCEDTCDYEAMSYRWGSTDRNKEILVDGKRFPVTRSAFKLLVGRRSIWRERSLWIDVLCVNQSDEEEKAAQIGLMGDIYRRASRVIAFPDADWRSRLAAPLIFELHLASLHYAGSEAVYSLDKQKKRWRWEALEELLVNDYFGRVWVVQEIALGVKVELFYGGLYIPWKTFFAVASRQTQSRRQLPTFNEVDAAERDWTRPLTFHPVTVMAILRPDSGIVDNHLTPTKLETILFTTCKFEATDARDKVFAILGLADIKTDSLLLTPDYTKPSEQVFENVARYLYLHPEAQSIHMLAFAGIGFSSRRKPMPSWVPDIGREILNYPFSEILSDEGRFRASLDRAACITESQISGCLEMKGVICDSILSLSPAGPFDIHPKRGEYMYRMQIGHYMYVFTECAVHFVENEGCLAGMGKADQSEQLWRTLIADRISRRCPADVDFGKAFPHWHRFNELQSLLFTSNPSRDFINSPAAEQMFEEFRPSLVNNSIIAYTQSMMDACYGRSFAVTRGGRLSLVPPQTLPGDLVFIPFGAQTPYLIRGNEPPHGEERFQLVGEAYVHGLMMGEGLGYGREQTIVIE